MNNFIAKIKKPLSIIAVVSVLFSCAQKDTSDLKKVVESFDHEKAYKATNTVIITNDSYAFDTSYSTAGKVTTTLELDKTDFDNLYLYYKADYSGSLISDSITSEEVLYLLNGEKYHKISKENDTIKDEEIEEATLTALINKVFFVEDSSGTMYYDGVYFGDYLKQKYTKLSDGYSLNSDKSLLTVKLKEKDIYAYGSDNNLWPMVYSYSTTVVETTYGLLSSLEAYKKSVDGDEEIIKNTAEVVYNQSIIRKTEIK
jgi:hypothetical protein